MVKRIKICTERPLPTKTHLNHVAEYDFRKLEAISSVTKKYNFPTKSTAPHPKQPKQRIGSLIPESEPNKPQLSPLDSGTHKHT